VADDVLIRSFQDTDLDAIVELSLRAWEPVFESLREVLGDPIFTRLHQPGWRDAQAEAVRSSCVDQGHDVFVAVADGEPVGFATVGLNAFHVGMGVVDMIAVATQLMRHSAEHMRAEGMDIAAVGTGGDPGHAPARAMYAASGYTALPVVRYLKLLD
jgi:acetyltransferase (GNAT) family protein